MGGTLEAFYYAFGDTDAYVIVDAPDNASIAAVALSGSATGRIKVRTTTLMKPEELDEVARKAPGYRAPGQ